MIAGCSQWLVEEYPGGVKVGTFCGKPIVRRGKCKEHQHVPPLAG